MNFSTISAILRGNWLIDRSYAESQLPIIVSMLKNHTAAFDFKGMSEREDGVDEDKRSKAEKVSFAAGRGVYKVGYYTKLDDLPQGSIAFVDILGPIMKYGGMCSYGSVDKVNILRKIDNAGNIAGVILNVDSPGGQVAGTTLLADQIKAMSKPVVAMVDDGMMASAAMWIGSSATEIYATKASDEFGSIGVYATLYDWNAYFKAEGLPVHEIYAPQSVEKNKDYRDALSGDYSAMKDDLSFTAENFISTIESNRPSASKHKNIWSKGGMFKAADAKKYGLIDGIKSFDEIVNRVSQLSNNSSKSKKNNMSVNAFQHTLTAAGAESFEVVEGGFLLQEDQLNSIEETVTNLQEGITEANLAAHQAQVNVTTLTTENENLSAANATQATEIERLNAEVARLNAATPAPARVAAADDQFGDEQPVSAVTAEANRLRKIKGLPALK